MHNYCTDGTHGVSPEACDLRGMMEELIRYRNQYLPGKEFWISEFGYGTNPASPSSPPAIGGKSTEEVQGEWLVRSYLELAAAGVDRAMMYMLRDVNGESTSMHGSSGLVSSKNTGWEPKASWYYVYTLKNRLSGLSYDSEQDSGQSDVKIYRFKNEQGEVAAYVLWSPTENDTHVNGYELQLEDNPSETTLVTLSDGDTNGIASLLAIQGGKVIVDVSERPVFVLIDDQGEDLPPVWPVGSTLTKTNETETGLTLTWTAAQDDNGLLGYVIYQNDMQIDFITKDMLSYDVIILEPGSYTFRIEARDIAGQLSSGGPTVESADIILPIWSQETVLYLSDISSSGLTISWSDTASDNKAVTGYRIYVDDQLDGTVNAGVLTYTVSGLNADQMYKFNIEAGDVAGNWSDSGPAVYVETLSGN